MSELIDGVVKQVALVKAVMADVASDMPVHGALRIVDSDLPAFGKLTFKSFPLLYPKRLGEAHNACGPLIAEQVRALPPSGGRHDAHAPRREDAPGWWLVSRAVRVAASAGPARRVADRPEPPRPLRSHGVLSALAGALSGAKGNLAGAGPGRRLRSPG